MILTLTLNPSIDRTVELRQPLARGGVHRLNATPIEVAAGKGVNVARAVASSGLGSRAIVMADPDDRFGTLLPRDSVELVSVPIGVPVRTNIALTEPDGTTTKLNEPGTAIDREARERCLTAIRQHTAEASWLVIAGSLPPATDASLIVEAMRAARNSNAKIRIAVDSSGSRLASAVAAGGVDLIKPNDEEIAELLGLLGLPGNPSEDPVAAAKSVIDTGVGAVLLTLGGAGAILVDGEHVLHAAPPPTRVRSTVGAGDASLAGWLIAHARGDDAAGRLAQAVALGSAAAAMPGTGIPSLTDADPGRVEVRTLFTSTTLSAHNTASRAVLE